MKKIVMEWRMKLITPRIFCLIVVSPANNETPISSGRGVAIRIPANKYKM